MVYPGDYSRGANFQNGYLILFQWYKRRNKHDKKKSKCVIQKMLNILSMELLFSKQTLRYQVFAYLINPSPPKIWLSILPSSYYTFPCKIDYMNLVFNQGNKLYLMSLSILTTCLLLWCMDTIRRSYMIIIFGS